MFHRTGQMVTKNMSVRIEPGESDVIKHIIMVQDLPTEETGEFLLSLAMNLPRSRLAPHASSVSFLIEQRPDDRTRITTTCVVNIDSEGGRDTLKEAEAAMCKCEGATFASPGGMVN